MSRPIPRIATERMLLTLPPAAAAGQVADFYARNQDHFDPWDPPRPEGFRTAGYWRVALEANRLDFQQGRSLRFFLLLKDGPVVGSVSFAGVARGPLQACHLGYGLDAHHQGQGLMTEALKSALRYVFEELKLHRVEANYLPINERSGRLLRRLGFVVEGYARDYLFIDGAWRDHIRTALTNPDPGPPSA